VTLTAVHLRRVDGYPGLGRGLAPLWRAVQTFSTEERDAVRRTMADEVDALLFPSLHDEAGFVVAEAVAAGLPVVCLDVGGPPLIAGGGVRPGGHGATAERLAAGLRATLGRAIEPVDLGVDARRHELLDLLRESGVLPEDRLPRG